MSQKKNGPMAAVAYWSTLLGQNPLGQANEIEKERYSEKQTTNGRQENEKSKEKQEQKQTALEKLPSHIAASLVRAPTSAQPAHFSVLDVPFKQFQTNSEKSPRSVVLAPASAPPTNHAWKSTRWKELNEKRLALGQKRIQLEQRLFETRVGSTPKAGVSLPEERRCQLSPNGATVEWSGAIHVRTNLPTGYGKMVYRDGQVYEGVVVDGLRHGAGKNTWCNRSCKGQVYCGEWKNGSRHGHGTHTWQDGKTVTGQWEQGHLHGRILFRWPDGATYDGDVFRGRKHGRGVHTQPDGSVYRGEFVSGFQHGFGTLIAYGQQYRGEFQRGQRHGFGVQIWSTKTYEGTWEHNTMQGRGKLVWRDTGAVYEGEFHEGELHGLGHYNNGQKMYVGQWWHGVREGRGAQRWPDGRAYDGWFRRDQRHGFGRMTYADGSVYIGGWKGGLRSGFGLEISGQDGCIRHCGLWELNEPELLCFTGGYKSSDDSNIALRSSPTLFGECDKRNRNTFTIKQRSRSFDERDLTLARLICAKQV